MPSLEPGEFLQLLLRHHTLHTPDVDDERKDVNHGLDDCGVEGSSLYMSM